MASRVIGLDFGATGIKLAEVEDDQGSYTVTKQAFMPVDEGIFVDGDIEEADVAVVAADLKAFLSTEKFDTRKCIIGLNGVSGIFANRTVVNWHSPKDFHNAVSNEMIADKSLLIGAPTDVIFDSVVLSEFSEEDRRKLDVLLVGASPRLVERMSGVAKKAGLSVVGAEPTAFAVLRAVKTANRPSGNLDVLVDIGHDVVSILIHECSRPYALNLRADLGGHDLDRNIVDATQDDDTVRTVRAKLAYMESPLVKRAVDDYLHKLCRGIESTISTYAQSSRTPVVPRGITLTGGGSLLPYLVETVANTFKIPTVLSQYADEIGGAPVHYLPGQLLSHDYTAAVGLAMGETI